ncbi:MAG: adenylyltransferase/cytidyltransferase family protein [Hornefia sp.]|nr:adenylyltransferase/cytidyltransferase family protein [Hornefia sp.]
MKKVITYGTYDLFHKGHFNILKRAREYGDYLIVGVTGENYDIGRGKLSVHDSLAERIENVKNTGLVDQIIVEEYLGQKISDIVKYDVDTFVIGDDWRGKFDHLSRYCNMVYLERTKGISSTQIRQENFTTYDVGIVTDLKDDNNFISESKLVNGFNVACVYATDDELKKEFTQRYNLKQSFADYSELVENSDIVYVRTKINNRSRYIEEAIKQGKHVISDPPFSLDASEQVHLYNLAKEHNVILMDNIKMVHIHVFNQLLWMTQGGLIGDILSINCSISREDKSRNNILFDLLSLALVPILKIQGQDFKNLKINKTYGTEGMEFVSLFFEYENSNAIINVGNSIRVDNQLEIIGTKGTIRSKGKWWRGNYFEVEKTDADHVEVYNTNYAGNGFKYLLKAFSTMLANDRIDSMGVFEDESIKIAEIMEKVNN